MLTAIVSGGQTGADRGGLDAAIELGLGYGGWAPSGWRAEDGLIPEIYRAHMRESVSTEYGMRTRLNVQDSDATLILSFASELTGGSAYTGREAKRQRKPCKHLVMPAGAHSKIPDAVRVAVLEWIRASNVSVLNIAGPRESKEPGLQAAVRDALVWIFEDEIETAGWRSTDQMLKDAERVLQKAEQAAASCIERIPVPNSTGAAALHLVGRLADGAPEPDAMAAEFIELCSLVRLEDKASVMQLVDAFYELPGNGAGGSLHIVLDDNNWERSSVEFCLGYAQKAGDLAGVKLAETLLLLDDARLHEWFGPGYCGTCCADYGDEHTWAQPSWVHGRCPDCGSFPRDPPDPSIGGKPDGAMGKPDGDAC